MLHVIKFIVLIVAMYGLTYVPGGIWVNAAIVLLGLWKLTK